MVTKDQFPIKFLFPAICFLAAALCGCRESEPVDISKPGFSIQAGRLFFQGELFSGKTRQENPAMDEVYITSYKDGLEDGEFIARKKSGQVLEKRFFKEGQKQGIHFSWFPNGNNRLYSEFDHGKYINDRWEWHDNGKPAIYEKFDQNGKILISKVWNRNGKIYMNLAFNKDGSSVGMPGSKICKPISSLEKK